MIATLAILLTALSAHAGCDDLPSYLERAEQALLEERAGDAAAALSDASVSFACGPLAEPELLSRYGLAEGALAMAQGELPRARLSFSAAYRVAPDHWPVDYGIKPFIQYQAAAQDWTAEATIKLHPQPLLRIAALDGQLNSFPATTLAGLHLVQVGTSEQEVEFATFVRVEPDDTYLVLLDLLPLDGSERVVQEVVTLPAAGQEPADRARMERRHPPALLASGALAAGLAATSATLALLQTGQMQSASDEAALNQAFARQQTHAQATYVTGGLAALGLGLYLVF